MPAIIRTGDRKAVDMRRRPLLSVTEMYRLRKVGGSTWQGLRLEFQLAHRNDKLRKVVSRSR